ncbi:MAG: ATP-binding cassette domain-containing protein, partial [Chloroflexota bacterium]|nr:ATP-binding cassette domain-containing protein [Chloroflexota bacterium]
NGAVKSTTLKLLTKILKPSRGRAEVRGRIGALIEIAAGFHPDLTGRENVYQQGAIMGMRRAEIARKFDEIVEFSGLADFIDTPVKRYSSGMNARLGFAIAAHLEPEVLIIDEVLAVGDVAFQERAFARIRTVVRSGIPVVVVSHQLDRISSLCSHAILLDRGSVVRYGAPAECISAYIRNTARSAGPAESAASLQIVALERDSLESVRSGDYVTLTISGAIVANAVAEGESVGVIVRALHTGQVIYASGYHHSMAHLPAPGPFELGIDLQMNVPAGIYAVETLIWDRQQEKEIARGPSLTVEVEGGPYFFGTVQLNPRMRLSTPGPSSSINEAVPQLLELGAHGPALDR